MTTKSRIPTYLVPLLAVIPVIAVAVVILVVAHRPHPVPISVARVQAVAERRFGAAYDWHCRIAYPPLRIVVCNSQPNGLYSVDYQVKDDGTPVLVASTPPPS